MARSEKTADRPGAAGTAPPERGRASPPVPRAQSAGRLVPALVGAMLGMLLSAVDQTVVGTAMPRIIAQLHGLSQYAWVTTSYMLASTVTVPVYGKLSDLYGRRPFYILGLALFLGGSALSGLSRTMGQLILFRGLQGLGAGAMAPIAQTIVADAFPPAERGKWQAYMMALFGLAITVSPWLGGVITDSLGWRWIFYINMPLGAVALLISASALPRGARPPVNVSVDYIGGALLAAAAVPMLAGLTLGGSVHPWGDPRVIATLAVSAVAWAAFVVYEGRWARQPIVAPRLFANPTFAMSALVSFIVSMALYGAILYVPLFVQGVLGVSAAGSGALLAPTMLAFTATNVLAGQLMARTRRYRALALAGLAVASGGMLLLGRMGVGVPADVVVRNMVVAALGLGAVISLFTVVAQNVFPQRAVGEVTAMLQFCGSVGATVGIASLGALMVARFRSALPRHLPPVVAAAVPPQQLTTLASPAVLLGAGAPARLSASLAALGPAVHGLAAAVAVGVRTSLALALGEVFLVSAAILALAFALTFLLPEVPLRGGTPGGDSTGR